MVPYQNTPPAPATESTNISRRNLFKFGVKVGAGLFAFVPAAIVLLKDSSTAFAQGCC